MSGFGDRNPDPTHAARARRAGQRVQDGKQYGAGLVFDALNARVVVDQDIINLSSGFDSNTAGTQISFFGGSLTSQPAAFSITAAPTASRALDADANGGAYTGIATGVGGTPYAAVVDLNDLRSDVESLAAVVRSMLDDASSLGLTA